MPGCCGCWEVLRPPRYKHLVDSIFPANPQDGLVKNNMDKLTFYAMTTSEKLDRIGMYLEQRLSRDISRHRIGFVFVAMDALDQLLVACHAHSLNLFVESFLKMVQKLLECDEPELQILATQSFIKFANIEEDTPSYHRRYDFFVSKFSVMSHSGNRNENVKSKIRGAGLLGLQGVVRKTVSDDLQVNIWDPVHMDKIVPSLLYNMHTPEFMSVNLESPRDEEHPAYIAEMVFRDLVCRASYGNVKSVLQPVLCHIDNHRLWVPNEFAVKCFKVIMYSVQQQYGYLVIQMLMSHLDTHTNSDPGIKASIIEVLYESVLISAGGSIGPSVLDVFNTLLRHLKISVDNKSSDSEKRNMEKKFEEAIINTIGEFANNLPDYQKIEIMMFIMGKFPQFGENEEMGFNMDNYLQTMLLKTLLKVATKYKTVIMNNAFPPEFLHPLLRISILEDPGLRVVVQEILHTLLDRHENTNKLKTVTIPKDVVSQLDLTIDKVPRQDSLFMKKNGIQFYWHIKENLQMDTNKARNFEALYCTMCLISIEMGGDDILVELIRLALDIQQMALDSKLPSTHQCCNHAIVAAYLNVVAQINNLSPLVQYLSDLLELRRKEASHLLPEFAFNRANRPSSVKDDDYPTENKMEERWLFDQTTLQEILTDCGHDASRLSAPLAQRPHSTMGTMLHDSAVASSMSDIGSINIELDSMESSPLLSRKKVEEITVESLKKMLAEDQSQKREEEAKKRQEIFDTFQNAPFEEILARAEAKSNCFHDKLYEILETTSPESPNHSEESLNAVPVFEMQFPSLYVY
ncbi:protein EFR3 homolog B-like isoform X2 [Ostrea edulis]|uniref:protein EFR3 homolog B-like isoform X2 n=1 Tax=Ostrea edulis TaxID=37623 RepID=UPI002095A5D5|nr:protein EFR3 homolog B-like isoform X2 [Ostrea edulis]